MHDWRKITRWPTSKAGGKTLRAGGWLLLVLLLSAGCAAGVRSSLLEADMRLASPRLGLGTTQAEGGSLPVVYPGAAAGVGAAAGGAPAVTAGENPMTAQFGPAWQGLEPVYREYRFNPFEP